MLAFASSPNHLTSSHQYRCRSSIRPRTPKWKSSLFAVAGATGGVGQLVVNRLLAAIVTDANQTLPLNTSLQSIKVTDVRVLARNHLRAREVLPQHNAALSIYPVTVTHETDFDTLKTALKDVEVLIICTGTTAFPTRAWRHGNTPQAVDNYGVRHLVSAVDHNSIKRVVLLSSIGTHRAAQFPFSVLNLFGVMDAKQRGEMHVQRAARLYGFSYAIVRPGRLVGGPHTNIGMIRAEPHPRKLDIEIAKGDNLAGDLSRSAAADAVFIAAKWDTFADLDISLVHREGPTPPIERWASLLKQVENRRLVNDQQLESQHADFSL